MHVLVINLGEAVERRAAITASLTAAGLPSDNLHIVPAVNAARDELPAGSAKPAERACWASHRRALSMAESLPGHVLIAEDDVDFLPLSLRCIDDLTRTIQERWHIVYTEACLGDPHDMIRLWEIGTTWRREDRIGEIDARHVKSLFGTVCYVVHHEAKKYLGGLLDKAGPINAPLDLWLRDRIGAGAVFARLVVPFLTFPGRLADASSIQSSDEARKAATEAVFNAYRRLMCATPPSELIRANLKAAEASIGDEVAQTLGRILALRLSPNLFRK